MIESGKHLESISEKFAILKHELMQNGKLGLLNDHKHCENLVKNLLNLVYDLKLENLNRRGAPFRGLDLGSRKAGIAFEVSAENSSEKINEKLSLIIQRKHYLDFPNIHFFFLSGKQKTYTVTTETEPYFSFDWKKNVLDFDDVLKDIQALDLNVLKKVLSFLSQELPSATQPTETGGLTSFLGELFKPKSKTDDDNVVYDMSKNLWDSIRPPNSNYVHRSKKISGIPAGTQIFTFQYGPTGQAYPLNLKGTHVHAEVGFSCKINNPMKAVLAANEYALNYLPPRFLIESRGILEANSPSQLRERRKEVATEIQVALLKMFDDAGVTLESVTIGAIDELVEVNDRSRNESMEMQTPKPKVLFFNYRMVSEQTYNLVIGVPPFKNEKKHDTYLFTFPLGLGNDSTVDTENISVIFKYEEQSPLPLSEGARLEDKSFIMPVERSFYKGDGKQCCAYKIPFIRQGSLTMVGELLYIVPTEIELDIPSRSSDGVDFIARVIAEIQFSFELIAMFKNCPSQYFKFNLQYIKARSFEDLLEKSVIKLNKTEDEKAEQIVYYPDFKKAFRRDGRSLFIGYLSRENFRILSKVPNQGVKVLKIEQNNNVITL